MDITTYRTEEYLFIFTSQLAICFPFDPMKLQYKQTSVYHPFLYYAPYEVHTGKIIHPDGMTKLLPDFNGIEQWDTFYHLPSKAMCDVTSYLYEDSPEGKEYRMLWTYTAEGNSGPNGRVFVDRQLTDIFDKQVGQLRLGRYELLELGWISVLEPKSDILAYILSGELTVNDHLDLVTDHYNKLDFYAKKGIILKT